MGDYFDLHIQQRTDAGWGTPASMPVDSSHLYGALGIVCDFRVHSAPLERLFLADDAILPLKKEWPPDFKDTDLYMRRMHPYEEGYWGWAPMGDLLVDEWSTTLLYVSRSVPSEFARHFADGAQPFPTQALLDDGHPKYDVESLEDTTGARDIRFEGRGGDAIELIEYPIVQRNRGEDLPRTIEVSWQLSIKDFLGGWQTDTIQDVRAQADDEDLRVICIFGG